MAPAKKVKAAAGRKVKDKWKAKEWYKIHAPRMFNESEIGETPSADPPSSSSDVPSRSPCRTSPGTSPRCTSS